MTDRSTADRLLVATRDLRLRLACLRFGAPVCHVYDPLAYAWRPHAAYVRRYAAARKRVVFLGMNPGPFGMAQTGVPFGEVAHVRDWLGICAPVDRPACEHSKRPVEGFGCRRSEVSGARVWGAVRAHFGTPERFFREHFVANYCPLLFLEASGRNRTPDKLPAHERAPLFAACDRYLQQLVRILEPDWVVGVGQFATERATQALARDVDGNADRDVDGNADRNADGNANGNGPKIARILHPSPANPRANRNWFAAVQSELAAVGLCRSPALARRSSARAGRGSGGPVTGR